VADVGPITTDQKKPAVSIFIVEPVPGEIIERILWGLEEEGIPYEIGALECEVTEVMAKRAADGSRLNVGIGINGAEGKAVLHHRDLPEEKPLFTLELKGAQPQMHLRTLGVNAARLVKGEPLVFNDEPSDDGYAQSRLDSASSEPDEVVEMITKILRELLNSK
jgi:hypothetical protein